VAKEPITRTSAKVQREEKKISKKGTKRVRPLVKRMFLSINHRKRNGVVGEAIRFQFSDSRRESRAPEESSEINLQIPGGATWNAIRWPSESRTGPTHVAKGSRVNAEG